MATFTPENEVFTKLVNDLTTQIQKTTFDMNSNMSRCLAVLKDEGAEGPWQRSLRKRRRTILRRVWILAGIHEMILCCYVMHLQQVDEVERLDCVASLAKVLQDLNIDRRYPHFHQFSLRLQEEHRDIFMAADLEATTHGSNDRDNSTVADIHALNHQHPTVIELQDRIDVILPSTYDLSKRIRLKVGVEQVLDLVLHKSAPI